MFIKYNNEEHLNKLKANFEKKYFLKFRLEKIKRNKLLFMNIMARKNNNTKG